MFLNLLIISVIMAFFNAGGINSVIPSAHAAPQTDANDNGRPDSSAAPTVVINEETTAGVTELRLPWKLASAISVFSYGGWLYLVSDQTVKFNIANMRKLSRPTQLAASGGSVMRVLMPPNMFVRTSRNNVSWILELRQGGRSADGGMVVRTEKSDANNLAVTIDMRNGGKVVSFQDQDLGYLIKSVPSMTVKNGVLDSHKFVQFDVIPSYQGVALAVRSDNIVVEPRSDNIIINSASEIAGSRLANAPPNAGILDFTQWMNPGLNWKEVREKFNRQIDESSPDKRPAIEVEFGRFYLATGYPADAIGMFDLASQRDSSLAANVRVKASMAVAKIMQGSNDEAEALLADKRFDGNPDVLIWRAAAIERNGDWKKANELFRRMSGIPGTMPAPLRAVLAISFVQSALENHDLTGLAPILDLVSRPDVPRSLRDHGEYLRAKLFMNSNDRDLGILTLKRLVSGPPSWARAHAVLMLVDAELVDKKITIDQAIDQIENMRLGWSGDEAEYASFLRLGDLYVEKGDVGTGLMRMRSAINYFPDRSDMADVHKHMVDIFSQAYDKPSSAGLSLEALSLFDRFKDLIPTSERGDKIVQNVADNLVAIDLLDRAAELLDHQIQFRLTGSEKARVGARLAEIELLDRKPDQALISLEDSEVPTLSPELLGRRRLLRARAQSAKGNFPEALASLGEENSAEALRLRAAIYGKSGQWDKAASALNDLLGVGKMTTLSKEQQEIAISLAASYILSDNYTGLRKLRDDMNDLMKSTARQPAFELLTSESHRNPPDVDAVSLAMAFSEVSAFQSALNNYIGEKPPSVTAK